MRSKISSKLIFASCVWYSDRAYYELCVLLKDIGRRLPLQLQCSYQGQQDDFSQSVRGNYKTRFWGGQNLTAVKGNAAHFGLKSRTPIALFVAVRYYALVCRHTRLLLEVPKWLWEYSYESVRCRNAARLECVWFSICFSHRITICIACATSYSKQERCSC